MDDTSLLKTISENDQETFKKFHDRNFGSEATFLKAKLRLVAGLMDGVLENPGQSEIILASDQAHGLSELLNEACGLLEDMRDALT